MVIDSVATTVYNVATGGDRMKDTVIRFRCTADDRAMIERMARNSGRTLTDFILHLCYTENARCQCQSVVPLEEKSEETTDTAVGRDGFKVSG